MTRLVLVLFAVFTVALAPAQALAATSSDLRVQGYAEPLNLFTSSAGPLCASGTMTVHFDRIVAIDRNGVAFNLFGDHYQQNAAFHAAVWVASGTATFSCPNGTLTVEWHAVGDPSDITPAMTGRFRVVNGTGAFAALSGEGAMSLEGTPVGFAFAFEGSVRAG